MSLIHKAYSASTLALAELRQVKVICSTGEIDREGEIIVQAGIDTAAYMATGAGTVLWNHNPDKPIAKCIDIGVEGGDLVALVQFPPEGEDPEADLYYGKIKFGSVSGVSMGFLPISAEPLDKGNPKRGPQKYLTCELMEFSFTPVQANRGSVVTAKSAKQGASGLKVGASRNLPVTKDFDVSHAGDSTLSHADFDSDSPDVTFARKGFLAYDATHPDDRESYRLPFAKMVDGRLTVCPALIKAARLDLMKSDFPEDVAAKAAAVLEHYEAKMTEITKEAIKARIKGLYEVARLAGLLDDLGWLDDWVEWEAAMEGDGSQVPAMLGNAMKLVGETLIAMTIEEVGELLAEETDEGSDTVAKGFCKPEAKPIVKAFVAAHIKAGRKFSASSISTMQEACKAIKDGHDTLQAMMGDAESTDTGETEKNAEADRVKANAVAKQKRLRELEVLRLAQPL